MKKIAIGILLLCSLIAFSQKPDSLTKEAWKSIYRASATKINDLVHTKLDVSFDYSKSWMHGKAWITLHPHFYATDSLCLDAKFMNIEEVAIFKMGKKTPLKFAYDSLNLRIKLDKLYKAGENYTVFINYVAKPNDIKAKGGMAISGAKGLYFINPLGKEKNKPTQIWTQGETESNSGWFPTIDKPNQKTTDEIIMTVPAKYQTLSNGILTNQKKNADGTRTDTWKMNLPHAPYLGHRPAFAGVPLFQGAAHELPLHAAGLQKGVHLFQSLPQGQVVHVADDGGERGAELLRKRDDGVCHGAIL